MSRKRDGKQNELAKKNTEWKRTEMKCDRTENECCCYFFCESKIFIVMKMLKRK